MNPTFEVRPAEDHAAEVAALIDQAVDTLGHDALSDPTALRRDIRHGVVALSGGRAVGYLALRPSDAAAAPETRAEIVMAPSLHGAYRHEVFGLLIDAAEHPSASGPLHLWSYRVTEADDAVIRAHGLQQARELYQMRVSLPLEPAAIATQAFRPGIDDDAWLEVNNRAFAWHPDQSGWAVADLKQRVAEPWFDADGFRLHFIDGRLAGFCWTKAHTWTEPPLGEIFVIAVDPDFAGRGLGTQLSLAGLQHLHERGLQVGMLYVEADNDAAVAMYRRLGFEVDHADRMYTL